MKIAKRIILTFVIVSLIPIIAISALSTVTIFNVSNDNAGIAADALESEELANIERVTLDVGEFIEERVQNYIDGVYMMESYCEEVFNGSIGISPQYSYFWDPVEELAHSGNTTIPGWNPLVNDTDIWIMYESLDISFDVSCWYTHPDDYVNPSDPFQWSSATQYYIDTSSNMDNLYRALHQANEDYVWLYMGFDPDLAGSRIMRNYPYDNLAYFEDWYVPGDPAYVPLSENWYDPSVETWYTNAESIETDDVAFTPNHDPTTDWVLSIGRPVKHSNGTTFGVVSADVSMYTIQSKVLDIEVLNSGYAYLLDQDGEIIAHPDVDMALPELPDIATAEFGSQSTSEKTAFIEMLETEFTTDYGSTQYIKDGVQWHMTHVNVTDDGFVLVLVVPAAEVIAPAQDMLSQVLASTNNLIVILVVLLAAVAARRTTSMTIRLFVLART